VALAGSFWGFWIAMVIMTIGELILMPTATTFVANLAPVDMRGRYMSLFALTWSVAQATGPLMGGFMSDRYGPASTWYGGAVIVSGSVLAFLLLYYRFRKNTRDKYTHKIHA
jgi:MFS family permease